MAKVLLVGSRIDMTNYVAALLEEAGWDVTPAVGPEEGLRQLQVQDDIDVMVLGGPRAFEARDELYRALRTRHPYALVVFPESPDGLASQLSAAFGETPN